MAITKPSRARPGDPLPVVEYRSPSPGIEPPPSHWLGVAILIVFLLAVVAFASMAAYAILSWIVHS